MSNTTFSTADPAASARNLPTDGPSRPASTPATRPHLRVTLFTIPFRSKMTAVDTDRLRADLDLVTQLSPKPGASAVSPGLVRLDHWSGLFLERGEDEGDWILEARTWDRPPPSTVDDWQMRAALAARRLDPAVPIPQAPPPANVISRACRPGRPTPDSPGLAPPRRTRRREPLLRAVQELIGRRRQAESPRPDRRFGKDVSRLTTAG